MRGRDNYDFSFSGLKTAVRLHVEALDVLDDTAIADIAASAQAAIVDVLVEEGRSTACAVTACARCTSPAAVAANGPLRAALEAACSERGIHLPRATAPFLHRQRRHGRAHGGRVISSRAVTTATTSTSSRAAPSAAESPAFRYRSFPIAPRCSL